MNYEYATIIIPLAVATALRNVAQLLDRAETDGMFVAGLSATGNLPATHFISSGQVPTSFVQAIRSPATLNTLAQTAFAKASQAYPYSLAQITAVLASCFISDGTFNSLPETPFAFIARNGLMQIKGVL